MMKRLVACLAAGSIAGAAFAKLPPPAPMTDAQKAEKAAKAKAGADKEAELLAKSQDRAAANYKKSKGIVDPKAASAAAKKK
jgi:Ni/Co efflux regulator RcnB